MKYKISFFYLVFAMLSLKAYSSNNTTSTTINNLPLIIEYNGSTYGFTECQRLSVLLHPLANKPEITWSRSVLYNIDSNKQQYIDNLKLRVINSIHDIAIKNSESKQLATNLVELAQFLKSSRFAYPLLYDFDPSEAIVNPYKNPKIPCGRYLLYTSKFSQVIKFIGLGGIFYQSIDYSKYAWVLFKNSRVPFKNTVDEIWLVEPMKNFKSIKVAYWNRIDYVVSESSTFFVPIPFSFLADEYKDLNLKILELLTYRIEE